MKLDTFFSPGRGAKPLIVFIHGMGMDLRMWADPDKARVLGGSYPLPAFLGRRELRSPFVDFLESGYPVLTWSQRRPIGPLESGLAELSFLVHEYANYTKNGLVLLGHSRGGLIACRYLVSQQLPVSGLITIASPHHGTTMAQWAVYLSLLARIINEILEGKKKREVRSACQRILGFLSADALKDLLPGSSFLISLDMERRPAGYEVSIGGTVPDLLKIRGVDLISLLSKLLQGHLTPAELIPGLGDGLVSASSSRLDSAQVHRDFPLNHIALLFDDQVRSFLLDQVLVNSKKRIIRDP